MFFSQLSTDFQGLKLFSIPPPNISLLTIRGQSIIGPIDLFQKIFFLQNFKTIGWELTEKNMHYNVNVTLALIIA